MNISELPSQSQESVIHHQDPGVRARRETVHKEDLRDALYQLQSVGAPISPRFVKNLQENGINIPSRPTL